MLVLVCVFHSARLLCLPDTLVLVFQAGYFLSVHGQVSACMNLVCVMCMCVNSGVTSTVSVAKVPSFSVVFFFFSWTLWQSVCD